MLYRILEAHDGKLPDDVKVTFANTGKEMPETLDFVQACSDNWGVDIVWLESDIQPVSNPTPQKKFNYGYKVVTYETASRKGEPFANMILSKKFAPNPTARFCTQDLKVKPIVNYLKDSGYLEYAPWLHFVGIRADEKRRAVKMHRKVDGPQLMECPLYEDGVTKEDVHGFWESQNFNLNLPSANGVTDWGNCDLCFLKGKGKRISIIRERPDLADWWIQQEKLLLENSSVSSWGRGKSAFGDIAYSDLKIIATSQGQLFNFDDESIPCFCGD